MIKMVVLDLDGTLLNSEKHISECDREAVDEAVRSGVVVTIFTGRNYHSALPYVEELEVNVPVVFQNGALIYDFSRKEVLRSSRLDGSTAVEILKRSRELGIFVIVYTDFFDLKDMFVERPYTGAFSEYLSSNSWRIVMVGDLVNVVEDPVELALIGDEERIRRIVSDLEGISVVKGSTIDGESFFEVFGPGCSKGTALEFISNHMGISEEEVLFVGDGYNDVEIMEKVGTAVAMENAPDDVKDLADWVTSSNDDCGVAKALRRFLSIGAGRR